MLFTCTLPVTTFIVVQNCITRANLLNFTVMVYNTIKNIYTIKINCLDHLQSEFSIHSKVAISRVVAGTKNR